MAEGLSAAEFMEGINRAGFEVQIGNVIPSRLILVKVLIGEAGVGVAGAYEAMEGWLSRVPLGLWKEGEGHPIYRNESPLIDKNGRTTAITVVAYRDGVSLSFLDEVKVLAYLQREKNEWRRELILGFNAKVEEEVEGEPRVKAAREKIARHAAEGERLEEDLLAIQMEARAARADRLEPFLFVAGGREI